MPPRNHDAPSRPSRDEAVKPHNTSLAAFALVTTIARAAGAVQGGVEDRATTHAVAVARGAPGTSSVTCSGTLVSANVVLTVRHCFVSVTSGERPCDATLGALPAGVADDLWVNVSPWTGDGASWKKVSAVRVPEPKRLCGDDVALLVLAAPASENEATPARPVTDEATFHRAVEERSLGLAAYGATDPRTNDLGTRRSRFDIPIRCVRGRPGFDCRPDEGFTSDREITSGGGPCRGDSGAAAILPSDRGVVFGVLSRGDLGAERTSCALGVFERTDLWAWLVARTVIDAAKPEAPAPEWATTLFPASPPPGAFCTEAAGCSPDAACVSRDERRSFSCAARCMHDANCDARARCADGLCVRADAPAAVGGCSTARLSRDGVGWHVIALALAMLIRARRERRRE